MKKISQHLLLLISAVFCSNVSAEYLNGITIKEWHVRADSGSGVVHFSKNFVNGCSDGGYWGTLPIDDTAANKMLWSAIMVAAAQKKTVNVWSAGCGYHNKITQIQIVN